MSPKTIEPPPPAEPVRIELAAGGLSVVVQAAGSLTNVAKKAIELYRQITGPDVVRGFGTLGFTATEANGPLPPELTLPARMTEVEPAE